MALSSCLYECRTVHQRFSPKPYRLTQNFFMFYLDLDELDELDRKLRFFSRNRWNVFNFSDQDHLIGPHRTARENIEEFARSKGMFERPTKLKLLTLTRTFGYIFSPVAFYFGFKPDNTPFFSVAEVGNTFGEQKPYWVGPDRFSENVFRDRQIKHYYISPFMDLDIELDFKVELPGDTLNIRVEDWKNGEKIFTAVLSGSRKEMTDKNLFAYAFRYPLVTAQVISMIHWHAFKLWRLGLPYHRKEAHPELQKDVTRAYSKR